MKPALSLLLFTTLAGAAQGGVVVLALASLAGAEPTASLGPMLWGFTLLLGVALAASFFHLGHPLRAWRAVLMWRTSWMSREVIVLPAFIAVVGGWAIAAGSGAAGTSAAQVLALLALGGAFAVWVCTAMIYVCIRFVQEWAHPLTIVNYILLGLASGTVLAGTLGLAAGDAAFAGRVAPWALAATLAAWTTRWLSLRRNARLKPRSTIQSATGLQSARVVQKSMGMTGGSFNTREFFHGASERFVRMSRTGFQVMAFALPLVLVSVAWVSGSLTAWIAAALIQACGMLVERWVFFAQARHPQNIYYQAVS